MNLKKLSRYAIIIILIISASVYFPRFYHKLVDKSTRSPIVYYSPVIEDFAYFQHTDSHLVFKDGEGNHYTRKEYEKLLPFLYYRDLDKWGVLPDTIQGLAIDITFIRHNSQRMRLRAKKLDQPTINLYPLFESQSDYTTLSYPPELFRINARMEFITARTNKINEKMSRQFTKVLKEKGFQFPAQLIGGNPTTRKPFDEGYFIVDNAGRVFHLRKVKNSPYCIKTPIPDDLNIRKIVISESVRREIYGFLITQNDEVYLISYDNYKLIKLPLKKYNPDKMDFSFYADPIYRTIEYDDNYNYYTVVFDSNYTFVDSMKISLTPKEDRLSTKLKQAIFPFEIKTVKGTSSLIHFDFKLQSWLSLIGILLSFLIGLSIKLSHKENIKENWFDIVLLLGTGIYGLLGVLLIKPDIWD
ncbi:MAG: DUF4857 domain-containing protein [Candidatus Marinimicrobia bacterium]|nr:DUF4857 domain-containing protein [Candidatus Neomarinimicrobiota bacterium]